jgi:alpha-L-rhamnosidase
MAFSPIHRIAACLWLTFLISGPVMAANPPTGSLHPANLRCEYLVNPLGIDATQPRLSWIGESSARGERQSAYQVLVASTAALLDAENGDRWDSGKVASDESAHVVYAGQPLVARAACFWKVRLWDRDGHPSAWSQPAQWTLGLLAPADWQARWIDAIDPHAPAAAVLIHSAVYESVDHGKSKDVAGVLTAMLAGGQRNLTVNNDSMGGDPAPEEHKHLQLEYEEAGQAHSLTILEGKPLTFQNPEPPVRYLRKSFSTRGPITSATLYVTALGLYECRLNGQRVGDHVLAPDWTDYNKRVRYQAYDVTSLVRPGDNALGALLAPGWYAGHIGNGRYQRYGQTPALFAQLEITQADGSVERVVTDGSWKSHASPILSADIMLGESYDARREIADWDQPGCDERDWIAANVRAEKPRDLDDQVSPPVRQLLERETIALTEPAPGHWTFDLGQNMVGVVRLKVNAPAGTTVTIRHAEMLNPDGTLYTTNLRLATSTDTYVCGGGGEQTWQPRFTFHGFRYVEVTGLPEKPAPDTVTGIVIGSDTPRAGTFTCSNPLLNQLMSNIEWGQRGNYLSVPTDCPQRDERLGWMGDAEVFVRTATDIADVASFFTKWLVDVDDAQTPDGSFADVSPTLGNGGTPAWGDAGVICPWTIYQAYGDKQVLTRHLPAMTRWVEYCREHSTGLLWDKNRGSDYGDWLSIQADTPKDVIGTAFFAYSTHLVAKAYLAVGDTAQAAKYNNLFADISAAFNRAYVAPDGRIKGNTQCDYAMALKFELLPPADRARAVQYLADDIAAKGNHLSTGFLGVSYLLPTLTEGGRLDVAYTLLEQDTFPSWLFSVRQGATTIWERWDGWTPEKGFQTPKMNSFNHYSLGSCGEWMYDTMAGIDWDNAAPGYKKMIIRPRPGGGIQSVAATRRTMYGEVVSKWTCRHGIFDLEVTIPANTTAQVTLPTANAGAITEGGRPIAELSDVIEPIPDGRATFAVGAGTYKFQCPFGERP